MCNILREKREALGMSQQELADKLGVTKGYISMLESGGRRPSLAIVERLADTLELDEGTILRHWRKW